MLDFRCRNTIAVEDSYGKKNRSVILYTSGDQEYTADDNKYTYTVVSDDCKVSYDNSNYYFR